MEVRRVASGSLLDGVLQDRISGEVGWQQKSYPLGGDGTHALVWVYSKDSGSESGSDRGWVDYLQWTPSGGSGGDGVVMKAAGGPTHPTRCESLIINPQSSIGSGLRVRRLWPGGCLRPEPSQPLPVHRP